MSWGHRCLPFPQNLAPSHRRYIEAIQQFGTVEAAARAIGVSAMTVANGLKKARLRAGVDRTTDLLERYRNAKANHGRPA